MPGGTKRAREEEVKTLCEGASWQLLCPSLHVDDTSFQAGPQVPACPETGSSRARDSLIDEGFWLAYRSTLGWQPALVRLRAGIQALRAAGWHASFIFMYDEAWQLMHAAKDWMMAVTGNAPSLDILAWCIDPAARGAGFSPHRDRQPEDSPASFRADGTAKLTTCWVSLTDATPDNSCLYMIPRKHDPGYFDGDSDAADAPEPLALALPNKEAFQQIRALPCQAGSAIIFTHRVIHWGSSATKHAAEPRIALSFVHADPTFEAPYFDTAEHFPYPPLRLRFALVCAQMLIYHERFQPTAAQLQLYRAGVAAAEGDLEAAYLSKVLAEFVSAAQSSRSAQPPREPNADAKTQMADAEAHASAVASATLQHSTAIASSCAHSATPTVALPAVAGSGCMPQPRSDAQKDSVQQEGRRTPLSQEQPDGAGESDDDSLMDAAMEDMLTAAHAGAEFADDFSCSDGDEGDPAPAHGAG